MWFISLTSCFLKLFESIILFRLLFFLELIPFFTPLQAGFRPGRSTLDEILYLSRSILDGFNKRRLGSRMILSTIDLSKVFDFVWHPTLFHKLVLVSLPSCFARWTQSFLSRNGVFVVYQNHKSRSFRVRKVFRKDPFLVLYFPLSSSVIFLLFCLLPLAALYADILAIWSSLSSVSFRLHCNGHSLLLSSDLGLAESRILAAPVDTRPRTPLISFCTVQLLTL